jgi:phage gp29-like protein
MSARIVFVSLVSAALLSSCSSPPDNRQGQCHPCTVSMKVGPLLKEAQQMIAAKNYEGATAKLNKAEAVKFNPDDETVITQMRQAVQIMQAQQRRPSQP